MTSHDSTTTKRRIVQIAACGVTDNQATQSDTFMYALCDDGTVWMMDNTYWRWSELPSIPQREINNAQ